MVPWRQDIVLEEGICVQIKDPHSMRAEEKRMQLHQCITGSVSVKSFHSLKKRPGWGGARPPWGRWCHCGIGWVLAPTSPVPSLLSAMSPQP